MREVVRDTEVLREEVLFKGGGGKLTPLGLSIRKRETRRERKRGKRR